MLGAGGVGSGIALVAPVIVSITPSESIVELPEPGALGCPGVFVVGKGASGSTGVVKVTTPSVVPWAVG